MALVRSFSPNQYRSTFLGSIGPFQATVTIASIAAGATGGATASAAAGANAAALASLLAASDEVFAVIPATPTVGVTYYGSISSNGTLTIQIANGTGSAYTGASGGMLCTVLALRIKTA